MPMTQGHTAIADIPPALPALDSWHFLYLHSTVSYEGGVDVSQQLEKAFPIEGDSEPDLERL